MDKVKLRLLTWHHISRNAYSLKFLLNSGIIRQSFLKYWDIYILTAWITNSKLLPLRYLIWLSSQSIGKFLQLYGNKSIKGPNSLSSGIFNVSNKRYVHARSEVMIIFPLPSVSFANSFWILWPICVLIIWSNLKILLWGTNINSSSFLIFAFAYTDRLFFL